MKNIILSAILWWPCIGIANDFIITGSTIQTVPLENFKKVIIQCYCPNNVKIMTLDTEGMNIEIHGELSSIGFHGDQKNPKMIPSYLLKFETKKSNGTLFLSSKEYTYIHHAFFVKKLVIIAPASTTVIIERIQRDDLEGRGR